MRHEDRYEWGTEENTSWMKALREDLLRFGRRFPSPKGGSYYLGDDGTPWTDRNRETWITARMAHVYGMGSMLGYDGCGELADLALQGLRSGELHDEQNGGWYAGVTSEGQILNGKQCYAHAFVILAACTGVLAKRDGAEALLEEALRIYDEKFWEEEEGLSCDLWDTQFRRKDPYRGLNANMHTVEAFLAVADVTGREEYRRRCGRIIDRVLGWAEANEYRIPEHFTEEWIPDLQCNREKPEDPFKPYGATPGHGIEWARLILQYCSSSASEEHTGEWEETFLTKGQEYYLDAAVRLYERAIADAWHADGAPGICYTTDWTGHPVVHDRMHWTLAEAINTAGVLYQVTGDPKYRQQYSEFLQYLDTCVLDHQNGSWFHQLNRQNQVIGTVWPGKSDLYHAFQATLIPTSPVTDSVALSVYRASVRNF